MHSEGEIRVCEVDRVRTFWNVTIKIISCQLACFLITVTNTITKGKMRERLYFSLQLIVRRENRDLKQEPGSKNSMRGCGRMLLTALISMNCLIYATEPPALYMISLIYATEPPTPK